MLTIEALTKVYKQGDNHIFAVNKASFTVQKGEFVALVGQSGSGKTTLLNMIGCIERPTSGRVLLEGKDLTAMEDEALARVRRRRIGHVYQDFRLLEMLTAEENIRMPCLLDNRPADEKRLRALAKLLGVDQRLRHLPRELSGGQRQRVAIARALINDPALLLADEPTGNLDSKNSQEIVELLKFSNKKYGQTLIVITHDENIALQADRVLAIEDGRITRDEVLRK